MTMAGLITSFKTYLIVHRENVNVIDALPTWNTASFVSSRERAVHEALLTFARQACSFSFAQYFCFLLCIVGVLQAWQ